jgi:dolichol-phosphate mannosyltransferase/undecaprenyl-phosphate 4-deoxy-4-formamido-L-arabinose transferase
MRHQPTPTHDSGQQDAFHPGAPAGTAMPRPHQILVSVVVPCYKSAASLVELADRVERTFARIEHASYELIFVNDSPFHAPTCRTLGELGIANPSIVVVELTKNFGQQPATLCGIEVARGDYIVTMDDDLQHAPEDIPNLLAEARHDAVIARFRGKKHSLFKRFTSRLKGRFDEIILSKPRSISLSPFRLLKAPIAKFMLKRNTPYPFVPALLFEITDDVVNVEVEHHRRAEGRSHYSLYKMIRIFSDLLINNSSLLLRAVGYLGLIIAFLAFVYAIVIVLRALLYDHSAAGWPSIFTAILFFGGMTMLTLGIVGEYLVRIIATTEQRPTYHVREIRRNSEPLASTRANQ